MAFAMPLFTACPDDGTGNGDGDGGSPDSGTLVPPDGGDNDAGSPVADGGDNDGGSPDSGTVVPPDGGGQGGEPRGCQSSSDCNAGFDCVSLPVDDPEAIGYCVEQEVTISRNMCEMPGQYSCCEDSDCGDNGRCVDFQTDYCGGPPPPMDNKCIYDGCDVSSPCADAQTCIPAGAFGYLTATCMTVGCSNDNDCVAGEGGQCQPFSTGPGACSESRPNGFFCIYDSDVCQDSSDCTDPETPFCAYDVNAGATACVAIPVPPP